MAFDSHARGEQTKAKNSAQETSPGELPKRSLHVARVSGLDQKKEGTTSIERQHEKMNALAEQKGFQCIDRLDFAETGRTMESERLTEILTRAKDNDHDVCIMEDVDRSFRLTRTGLNFIHEYVTKLNKELWISGQCVNTMSTDEWTMFEIMMVFAENKSRKNGDASEGKRRRIGKYGYWYRKEIPLGYLAGNSPDPEGKVPVLREDERIAKIIIRLFHRLAEAHWMEVILEPAAAELGFTNETREDMFSLIRNPIYKGQVPYGKDFVHSPVIEMVEPEVWAAANLNIPATRSRRKSNRTSKTALIEGVRQASALYNLVRDGLLHCSECRGKLNWGGYDRIDDHEVPRLYCTNGHWHQVTPSEDLRFLKHDKTCWGCAATGLNAFSVNFERGTRDYITQCRHCGWKSVSDEHPFKDLVDHDDLTGEPFKPAQRRLTKLPRRTKGRGRRKRGST